MRVTALAAIAGLVALLPAAFAIYGISLILLFSAIFILIAGTYTPISLIVLSGVLGTIVLATIYARKWLDFIPGVFGYIASR
jgi:predicted membrane channel-forming protein YqfA (hemolysin III family)